MNILILDDEENLCRLVEKIILKMGYVPIIAHSLAQAGSYLENIQIDLAIVDINLPDGNGYDFAKQLRLSNKDIGIVILTVRDTTEDKVRGYTEGADIYLPKPFNTSELQAIIYSLSRRYNTSIQEQPLWKLRTQERRLESPGRILAELTERESNFIELIFTSKRNIISKREFVEALGFRWIEFDNRRFDTLISRLRKRVKDQTGVELPLKADRRGNYYFVSPCQVI